MKAARQTLLEAWAHFEATGDSYTALFATFTLGEGRAR